MLSFTEWWQEIGAAFSRQWADACLWRNSRFEIHPGSVEAQLEWASKTELTMAEDALVESLCLNFYGASVSVATVEASNYKPVQMGFGMVTHCLYTHWPNGFLDILGYHFFWVELFWAARRANKKGRGGHKEGKTRNCNLPGQMSTMFNVNNVNSAKCQQCQMSTISNVKM